ncbi:serine hydrolase domain-containing protein [Nonomuraea sp. NPDC048826]|uniref:serine hydrolase domain-containing protein n=1 Tax=Nonomuraea sp. NPDC048826 TaxID=3364347 RepID=UPI00371C20AC
MTTPVSPLRPRRAASALAEITTRWSAPGAIGEVRAGEEHWPGAAGHADVATGRPRRADERFRAGSVTKMFVAATTLLIAADGGLGLDDPVARWLPELPPRNGNDLSLVTVRHLLGHTGGLFDYTREPAMHRRLTSEFPLHRTTSYRPMELAGTALDQPPAFPPGAGWAYSNTGYVLAGLVVERATGRDFRHEVRARVIEPLALTGTSFPGEATGLPEPHARHYSRLSLPIPFRGTLDVTELNPSFCGASGELISTVGDLTRFLQALLRGRLLAAPELAEMLTPVEGSGGGHGLGVKFRRVAGRLVAGYDGAVHGSITSVFGALDGSLTAALNVNSDWQDETAMTTTLMTAALDEEDR